ncbi:MAG TPA: NmrA family NAD(P)-binding protein [Chryseolinea sp.]|nr:NmrA family NAD(P)-binding protein [Chryseolinea sp.]
MNIVLTGSLGHITKPLAIKLLERDHTVTIISSDVNKQSHIQSLGAMAATGSLTDTSFLAEIFKSADVAYCMTPPDFSAPDQIAWYEKVALSYADAIVASRIRRAIYLSSYGAHLPSGTGFITGSYRAEKILDALPGVLITHIRPTFFYYNLFAFIRMIKAAGFIGAVYGGDDKLAMVSPQDIASAVAEEMVRTDGHAKIRYVTSDDRTCNAIAQVLGTAIGKPNMKWNVLPPADVMKALLANGMSHHAAENLIELGLAVHSGILREDYEKHKPTLGNTRLEEFANEFADRYNQGSTQH